MVQKKNINHGSKKNINHGSKKNHKPLPIAILWYRQRFEKKNQTVSENAC